MQISRESIAQGNRLAILAGPEPGALASLVCNGRLLRPDAMSPAVRAISVVTLATTAGLSIGGPALAAGETPARFTTADVVDQPAAATIAINQTGRHEVGPSLTAPVTVQEATDQPLAKKTVIIPPSRTTQLEALPMYPIQKVTSTLAVATQIPVIKVTPVKTAPELLPATAIMPLSSIVSLGQTMVGNVIALADFGHPVEPKQTVSTIAAAVEQPVAPIVKVPTTSFTSSASLVAINPTTFTLDLPAHGSLQAQKIPEIAPILAPASPAGLAEAPAVTNSAAGEAGITFPLRIASQAELTSRPDHWCSTSLKNCHHDYNAADILDATGTVTESPVSGTVTAVHDTRPSSVGSTVQIRESDDGSLWYMAHQLLGSIDVKVGEHVDGGTAIGKIGTKADAMGTTPHLHIDHSPPGTRSRANCAGKACTGLPFINIQPVLIAAFNKLPKTAGSSPAAVSAPVEAAPTAPSLAVPVARPLAPNNTNSLFSMSVDRFVTPIISEKPLIPRLAPVVPTQVSELSPVQTPLAPSIAAAPNLDGPANFSDLPVDVYTADIGSGNEQSPRATAPETPLPAGLPEIAKVFTKDVVRQMLPGASEANIDENYPLLLQALAEQKIDQRDLTDYALSTIGSETGSFKSVREYPNPKYKSICENAGIQYDAGCQYDPAVNRSIARALGNTQVGDGSKYAGEGLVQLTGRSNFATMGTRLHVDLINHPELARDPAVSARILAIWIADRANDGRVMGIRTALRTGNYAVARARVNGGSSGLAKFTSTYQLGLKLTDQQIA